MRISIGFSLAFSVKKKNICFHTVTFHSEFNFPLQGVTVIFRRRGGDDLEQSHAKWADTVRLAPDVINMTFTPIVSLLEGVPGIKHLARAIDLYLECKINL